MRRKWIWTVLGLLLVPPLLLLLLATTESGSRWVVRAGSDRVPGLSIGSIQGSLTTGLRLGDVGYQNQDGLQSRLDSLVIRWSPTGLLKGRLHLRSVQARGMTLVLPEDGTTGAQPSLGLPRDIKSPLAVQLDLLALTDADIRQGHRQWHMARLVFSGRFDTDGLQLDHLELTGDGIQLAASGRAATEHPFRMAMQADWRGQVPGLPEISGHSELAGDVKQIVFTQKIDLPTGARISGSFRPDLKSGRHHVDLTAEWAELAIPIGPDKLYSRQGRLSLKGELSAYELSIATRLQHPAVSGQFDLEASGRGDLERLQIDKGRLLALGGESRFSGHFSWAQALAWDANVEAMNINPGTLWPEWPGSLAMTAVARGSITAGKPQLDLEIARLQGQLRGYQVKGLGKLAFSNGRLFAHELQLHSGVNYAWLDGRLFPALKLSFDIDAPDLRQLAPALVGSMKGKGRVEGELANPAAQLSLHGKDLALGGVFAGTVVVDALVDPANAQRSHWTLQGERLQYHGLRLDRLAITGNGSTRQHEATFQAAGMDVLIEARTSGSYVRQQWRGELAALTVTNPVLGAWRLTKPVALHADKATSQVDTLCLTQQQASLCAKATRDADGRIHSSGELDGLPIEHFKPWLAADTDISGSLGGSFNLEGKPPRLQATADLQVSPGILRYRPATAPELVADHHHGHLKIHYREDSLEMSFGLGLGDDGLLQGRTRLGPDVAGQRALQGELDFRLSDPKPLGAFAPQLTDWSGAMRVHGRLGGTLQHPAVQLEGNWHDGQVRVPDLGITLSRIKMDLAGDGDHLTLHGEAASGKGAIRVQGRVALDQAAGWPVRLHVEGKDFQVVRRTDQEIDVSPDLEISLRDRLLRITGQLKVPYARLVIAEATPGIVRVSDDEIVVGSDSRAPHSAAQPAKGPRLEARIRLIVGDDVRVKGYGMDGRLAGEVDLHQEPENPVEVVGQLHLVDGRYRAYGQDLTIEHGRLLFAGPVQSANVDIRAIRKVGNVTAGLMITGLIGDPVVQLFSEPPMEQAQILSYLLTGAPLSDGKEIDAMTLTQAAVSLGLADSTPITAQIAGSLGVDELTVTKGEQGLESSAMVIGKRLSPDLYVRYLYGLFDNAASMQLRYTLSRHIRLEGTAGEQRSLDLIFEIEKD